MRDLLQEAGMPNINQSVAYPEYKKNLGTLGHKAKKSILEDMGAEVFVFQNLPGGYIWAFTVCCALNGTTKVHARMKY